MKKEEFRQWVTDRVASQTRLVTAAVCIMAVFGLVAFLIEAIVVKWIIVTGFVGSHSLAWLITLAILGTVLLATWLRMPKHLADGSYPAEINGAEVSIAVAPAMGVVWTFALGSIDSDRTLIERLLGLLAMPQRLLCAAWYVYHRVQQLRALNIPGCAAVLRVLFRKAERVEVSEIAEKLPNTNLPPTLHDVSLIDGVVFLTRRTVGISLAPRLVDDLNAWKTRRGTTDDFDD